MANLDKIRVLILEDNKIHIAMAKAGLIPLPPKGYDDIDVKNRVRLANENYNIEHVSSYDEAVKKLETFNPDLAIIDINLKDKNSTQEFANNNKTGIDLYRFLETKLNVEKILFSAHFATPKYHIQLSVKERNNFIPKATSGVGYEILATKITDYLKSIAEKLVSDLLETNKKNFESDVKDKSFEHIKEYPYTFNGRKIKTKHLLMFCSFPIVSTNGQEKISLEYLEPDESLASLIHSHHNFVQSSNNKWTSLWRKLHVQNALSYYHEKFQIDYENYISSTSYKIIDELFKNILSQSVQKLSHNVKQFNLEYFKNESLYNNTNFFDNFLNLLVIRRVYIFIELFAQTSYDNGKNLSKIKKVFKTYLEEYFTLTMQYIKDDFFDNSSREQRAAYANMLNFSFINKKEKKSNSRETLRLNVFSLLPNEEEWIKSGELMEAKIKYFSMVQKDL